MGRILALFVAAPFGLIFLAGCGGVGVKQDPEESFQQLVDGVNAQHPPLYDGTNTFYPRGG